ncbi:uncharacterized protein LOC110022956 [Phalaenopsis equestris]|uniref:uncharacterized protein LOC110022956 n=1 Tax=Phalaenopsis equestris TaxID=78828 RepID=UPI0009E277A5|nr:uncharacterized protein LOC110022956 [Phalaenopsis equestris]
MAQANSKITLKLLIDARSNKVLFVEAGKEFIDFMFSLLTLPLGCVIKLLSPTNMIGSIGKLYPLLLGAEPVTELKLVMSYEVHFVAPYMYGSPSSGVNTGESVEGFVKGVITYMITDDMEVTPISAISSITSINRFSMNKEIQLEEEVVDIGMEEGLALLKA